MRIELGRTGAKFMSDQRGVTTTINLPIVGMDCADEANQIEAAVGKLPGVSTVRALVSAQRATVTYHPDRVTPTQIVVAISETGCSVRLESASAGSAPTSSARRDAGEVIGWGVLGLVALVVLVAALGERL